MRCLRKSGLAFLLFMSVTVFSGSGATHSVAAVTHGTFPAVPGLSVNAMASAATGFAVCQNGSKADITAPAGPAIITGRPTFQWAGGVCVTQYYLYIGSAAGQADLFSSGPLDGTITSVMVNPALLLNGEIVEVRLWSLVNGTWAAVDHSYIMGACQNPAKADITSPAGGSITTGTPTFQWSGGACVTQYYLYVGNSFGGADLFSSGPLGGTVSSAAVSPAIAIDGRAIYVRLWSLVNGTFQAVDHSYIMGSCTGPAKADITSPVGGTIVTSTPTFQWSGGQCVTQYYLYAGSAPGQADLFSAGPLAGTTTQATVNPAIPLDGRTIYVRLWSLVNGSFQQADHSYIMGACNNPAKADITAPSTPSITTGRPSFQWAGGVCVTQYYLYIGSAAGQADLFSAGPLGSTVTEATVSPALLLNGEVVEVRLWSLVSGTWQAVNRSYVMGVCQNMTGADISSPTAGTLHGPSQSFQWDGGQCVTQYHLYLGTSFGGAEIYNSGQLGGTVTAQPVTTLPANGSTVYLRLWSLVNGTWQAADHTYVSAP